MCAIPQLVSAPLNPIPTAEHFRRIHPQCEHSYGQHKYELNKHVKQINHAHKTKVRTHTYRDTTEKII